MPLFSVPVLAVFAVFGERLVDLAARAGFVNLLRACRVVDSSGKPGVLRAAGFDLDLCLGYKQRAQSHCAGEHLNAHGHPPRPNHGHKQEHRVKPKTSNPLKNRVVYIATAFTEMHLRLLQLL